MTTRQASAVAPLFIALLAASVTHASGTGAWHDPATFIGIAVGLAIGAAAWIYGRRRAGRRDHPGVDR